jgi:cardiolipin synthase A/B
MRCFLGKSNPVGNRRPGREADPKNDPSLSAASPAHRALSRRSFWYAWPVIIAMLLATGCGPAASSASTVSPIIVPSGMRGASGTTGVGLGNGVGGVSLVVEPQGDTRWITAPIKAAKHTLDLTMYLLTEKTIIHALEYAKAKGVTVRVILEHHPFGDDDSEPSTNQSVYDQLDAAGISVHWASSAYALTHEKSMVIDGSTAYILTLNFTWSAFNSNREFGIADRTPADVAETKAIFTADWAGVPYAPRDPNIFLSPINSRAHLIELIGRAKHTIEVYAEEVQDSGLEAAMVAASRRGVRVRLISNAGDTSNTRGIAVLTAGGVAVHLIAKPYIHAKLVLVDHEWAFVGSENISTASLDRNRELGILIRDPAALSQLVDTFNGDWRA